MLGVVAEEVDLPMPETRVVSVWNGIAGNVVIDADTAACVAVADVGAAVDQPSVADTEICLGVGGAIVMVDADEGLERLAVVGLLVAALVSVMGFGVVATVVCLLVAVLGWAVAPHWNEIALTQMIAYSSSNEIVSASENVKVVVCLPLPCIVLNTSPLWRKFTKFLSLLALM